ncbi:hypothetical protein niasHS_017425 [Heterodera schachtii]|uniref:OCEL domain-containing protein n=2 Tax=Heterodera TaxID=34509 RepID=A0ABD2I059_HETSC
MSKIKYSSVLQPNHSNSSISSFEQVPPLTVCKLDNSDHDNLSLLLKLTDECCVAIRQAIKLGYVIRMHIRKQEAQIEIIGREANPTIFKCTLQNQTETDSIRYDPKENNYTNVGSAIKTKLQVQATSKAFTDLKEKTQKLVEAEQQKKAKDMPKSQKASDSQRQMKTHNSFLAKYATKRTHSPSPNLTNRLTNPSSVPIKQRKQAEEATKLLPKKTVVSQSKERVEPHGFKELAKVETLSKETIKTETSPKKDLFYIPKRKALQSAPSISPASTATSTPKTISPPIVRPPSVESTLQHSSSCSPEDSFGSMTIPTKPSRDWSREFTVILNQDEAKRYHNIFKNEYAEYRRCYDDLTHVAQDFLALKSTMDKANDAIECQMVVKRIREKFTSLQNDQQFMLKRQRHTDLHAKLNAIKKALEEWNKREENDLY